MSKFFINDNQAESILNIKLRALRKLEEEQINAEHESLKKQHAQLCQILENPRQLWKLIKTDDESVKQIKELVGLRSKLYSFIADGDDHKHNKCKGVKNMGLK